MMSFRLVLCALCALSTLARAQVSGIYVEFYTLQNGWQAFGNYPDRNNNEPGLSSGSNVSITNANSLAYRVFAVSDETTDIGNVYISASQGTISPKLYIGQAWDSFVSPFSKIPAGCRNLGGVSYGLGKPELHGQINGTLTGTISVYRIRRFDFGTDSSGGAGMISGNITHNPGAELGVGSCNGIYAKYIDSSSIIKANRSNLSILQVYNDFEGTVQSLNMADIGVVNVLGDYIGGTIDLNGDLGSITVTGDATGSIETDGDIQNITILGHWGALPSGGTPNYDSSSILAWGSIAGTISVGGDFVGSLSADSLLNMSVSGGVYDWVSGAVASADISLANDVTQLVTGEPILGTVAGNHFRLDADQIVSKIEIGGDYSSGAITLRDGLPAASVISIGGTLETGVAIQLNHSPADPNDVGLAGRVLINTDNSTDEWLGSVTVGSTTLLVPDELDYTTYYTELSSELGGGVTGQAPFNFHQRETAPGAGETRDCNPYQKETRVLGRSDILDSVDISHYGPIYVVGEVGDGPHFRVEFLPWMDVNQTWVDRTSLFEVDISATSNSLGSTNRIARIKSTDANTKGFKAAGTWRIRPIPGKVKCAGVTGNPNVRYVSSVVSGDLGAIGIWNWYQFDVSLELEPGVFALDSGNGVQSTDLTQWMLTPYETNADGETDTQDFVDLANQYTGN